MTHTHRADDSGDAHVTPVTPGEDARTVLINNISWGAVLAGVVVALTTTLILNLFGLGVGIATLDPGTGDNPAASTLSIAAALWWVAAGVFASAAGGYVAGRLCGRPKESTAGYHGLTSWAATTLLIFYMLTTSVGAVVGGVYNSVSGALGTAVEGAASAAGPALNGDGDLFAGIEEDIRATTGGNDPAALRDAAISAVRAAVTGDEAEAEEARGRAAQALATARNVPLPEAEAQIDDYVARYQAASEQAVQQATEIADATARVVSLGAIFATIALVLGGVAAWFAGRSGAVDPTVTGIAVARRRV